MKKFQGQVHDIIHDETDVVIIRMKEGYGSLAVTKADLRAFLATQLTDEDLNRVLDNILRQVVCDCGNYRHHGVGWMPNGSGEGLVEARDILRRFVKGE